MIILTAGGINLLKRRKTCL
uniref:Uncharacterized protein n=1 Tax=Thermodesulfovibrio aggregans TaxID=86166 RepID=A0A7C4EKD7_9BACT